MRDAATLTPLAGITVEVCSNSGCQQQVTQSQGGYFFALAPGTYWVFTNNEVGYTNEIYDNILCKKECSPVDAFHSGRLLLVVESTYPWNAGFDLDRGARIAGTVTDSLSSVPLGNVEVQVIANLEGWPERIATARTNATGEYEFTGLPARRYFLRTFNEQAYVDEIYPNLVCARWCEAEDILNGQAIDVSVGASAAGRDSRGSGLHVFMSDLARGAFTYAPPTVARLSRAMEVDRRFADLGLGLVDSSIVALAELLGIYRLATRDVRHFAAVRLRGGRPFDLVVHPTNPDTI